MKNLIKKILSYFGYTLKKVPAKGACYSFTIESYAKRCGLRLTHGQAVALGHFCARLSREQDKVIRTRKHKKYGEVKAYDASIVKEAFKKYGKDYANGEDVVLHPSVRESV